MNKSTNYIDAFSDKNVMPLIAQSVGVKTPRLILSRTMGIFRDSDYKFISENDAAKILADAGEVFAKPALNSNSGRGCLIVNAENSNDAKKIFDTLGSNFVIQERLRCHEDIAEIYSGSVNTFRILSYILHDRIKTSCKMLRIGHGGHFLDNVHQGGLFVAVDDDGTLHEKAFTEFNLQFTEHPDTHKKFAGHKIKLFPKVLEAIKKMHEAIPQVGAICWDFTISQDGSPTLIEGNVRLGGTGSMQMSNGRGLFGDDTAEILQWMRKMKHMKLSERVKYITAHRY